MKANYIPAKRPALLLATVVLTTIITVLDATIANVALPHMMGSLSATQDQISWVLTSYVVASAILTPPTGFLATRLGRQRLLIWCLGGFLVSSMLCGAATSLEQMVIFRLLQGAFGAGMAPLGQSLMLDHFPPEQHGKVLSLWGMGAMIGPILGPSLGGYLTENLNWRWVFYINVPLCLLALVGTLASVPQMKLDKSQRFDFLGFGFLSLAIGAFQLMLDRGQSANWFDSAEILIEATIALLCFYLFVVHIFTGDKPFIDPGLFKDRNFGIAMMMVTITQVVLMGQMALLPNFLQQLMHLPVGITGNLLVPRGVATMFGMLLVGRLIGRVDSRWLMIFGLVVVSVSTYEMAKINLYVDNWTIMRLGIQQGFGTSFMMMPITSVAYTTLAPSLRNEGTSMFNLLRNIGGSIGISLWFTQIAQDTQTNHQHIGEHVTAFTDPLPSIWDWSTTAGAMTLDAELTRQAASVAYMNSYLLMTLCLVAIIPLCMLLKRVPKQTPTPEMQALAVEH